MTSGHYKSLYEVNNGHHMRKMKGDTGCYAAAQFSLIKQMCTGAG